MEEKISKSKKIKYPKIKKKFTRKRTLKEIYDGKKHNSPIKKKETNQIQIRRILI